MWASGSSTPVKVIFGPMKLAGITMSIIACENSMRAIPNWYRQDSLTSCALTNAVQISA